MGGDRDHGLGLANRALIAHAQQSPQFAVVYAELHEHWRAPMLEAVRRGVARGELRRATDAYLLVDLLLGPQWYRLLVGHREVSARDARSDPAQHRRDPAEDGGVVAGDRLVGGVVRHQPDVAVARA